MAEAPTNAREVTASWRQEEFRGIAACDHVHVAPLRSDGTTYATPTLIWAVEVGGELYVRAYNGQSSRWYQAALRQKAGRIVVGGQTKDVAFEPADEALSDCIDEAYQAKYRTSAYLRPMISARARSATVRVMPRAQHQS
jgi:hypothetical protein